MSVQNLQAEANGVFTMHMGVAVTNTVHYPTGKLNAGSGEDKTTDPLESCFSGAFHADYGDPAEIQFLGRPGRQSVYVIQVVAVSTAGADLFILKDHADSATLMEFEPGAGPSQTYPVGRIFRTGFSAAWNTITTTTSRASIWFIPLIHGSIHPREYEFTRPTNPTPGITTRGLDE